MAKYLLFFFILSCYIFSSPPTITTGDAGEFVTAACTLGVAHPPGFPLYCILGKAFSISGLSNPAWRVALLSMVFSSLTVVLIFLIILELSASLPASLIGALVYGFSQTVFSQSLIAEVYSLNAFFTALCIFLLLKFQVSKNTIWLYRFAAVFGVSLSAHYPLMLLSAAGFAFMLFSAKEKINFKNALICMALVLAGLLVYSYLPLSSLRNPPIDWGNPENFKSFISHIMRNQYKTLELGGLSGLSDKLDFIKAFLFGFVSQFGFSTLFILAGFWFLFKSNPLMALGYAVLVLANGVVLSAILTFQYTPERLNVVEVYYIPSYIIGAILCGAGISAVAQYFKGSIKAIIFLLLYLVVAFGGWRVVSENCQRKNFLAYDYAKNILLSVAPGSTLFMLESGDESLFTVLYLQKVAGFRKDLAIYDCWGNVFENIYGEGFTLVKSKSDWLEKRERIEKPLMVTAKNSAYFMTLGGISEIYGYKLIDSGLVKQVETKSNDNPWPFYRLRGVFDNQAALEYQEREILGVYYLKIAGLIGVNAAVANHTAVLRAYDNSWVLNNAGLFFYRSGDYEAAKKVYSNLLLTYPKYFPALHNMGLVYRNVLDHDNAIIYFERALKAGGSDTETLKELADAFWQKGELQKAANVLKTLFSLNSNLANEYLISGGEFYKKGNKAAAIEEWKKVLVFQPENAMAYYNIGVAYIDLGNNNSAKLALNEFLKLEPNSAVSKSVRNHLKVLQ